VRHRRLAMALTALATIVTMMVSAQPAQAAPLYYREPGTLCWNAGYACAWYGEDGQGGAVGFYDDAWDWGAIPNPYRGINNQSSSWESHGTGTYGNVRFLANPGGSGANKCLKKGYSQDGSDGMNDVISSNVWVSTCSGYTQFSYQIHIW
jgi:hypothetical protein